MCKKVLIIGLLAGILLTTCWASSEQETGLSLYSIASLQDLLQYPHPVPASERSLDQELYVTTLPDSDLVVILRPITESEYGSFQIQAIGYEIIERQMLAAAIVLPLVSEADVAGFAPELVAFLQQQVNIISGFAVFEGGSIPSLP